MTKYKIKDLLLVYENKDCRFAVLNNNGDKIKIITKKWNFLKIPLLFQ